MSERKTSQQLVPASELSKGYERPEVRVLGDFAALTQGQSNPNATDNRGAMGTR
jgi:hypothetical protein